MCVGNFKLSFTKFGVTANFANVQDAGCISLSILSTQFQAFVEFGQDMVNKRPRYEHGSVTYSPFKEIMTVRPTNGPVDRPGHSEVTLPLIHIY